MPPSAARTKMAGLLDNPFRPLMICEMLLALTAIFIVVADSSSIVSSMLNPHTQIGGLMHLVLFGSAILVFITLVILLPRGLFIFIKIREKRSVSNLCTLLLGFTGAALLAAWLSGFLSGGR